MRRDNTGGALGRTNRLRRAPGRLFALLAPAAAVVLSVGSASGVPASGAAPAAAPSALQPRLRPASLTSPSGNPRLLRRTTGPMMTPLPAGAPRRPTPPPGASFTLLDEVGRLARTVSPAEVAEWQHTIHRGTGRLPVAAAEVRLGEWLLANEQDPAAASHQFRAAAAMTGNRTATGRLAAWDLSVAAYYAGDYNAARDRFQALLRQDGSGGYQWQNVVLWLRHVSACIGQHERNGELGIPEPPRLDRFCGAAALAASLRALGLPYDRASVLRVCRVTGEGSTGEDLVAAGKKLGLSVHVLSADDKALQRLPLPMIAYVERDHFISLVRADRQGVSYLCSDCGPWPGGKIDLTWKQWHALSPSLYYSFLRRGTTVDRALEALRTGHAPRIRLAAAGGLGQLGIRAAMAARIFAQLKGHVALFLTPVSTACGYPLTALHCGLEHCPMDNPGGGGCGGPSAGDPVNLATGEEEYIPDPDLFVYNPRGPSIVWSRLYNSLRGYSISYESDDFGQGWSQSYNYGIYCSSPTGGGGTEYVWLPNGAQLPFTCSGQGGSYNASCTFQTAGTPMVLTWIHGSDPAGSFQLQFKDGSTWTFAHGLGYGGTGSDYYYLASQTPRHGYGVNLNYTQPEPDGWQLLQSITDSNNGSMLLWIQRANTAPYNILYVSDQTSQSDYQHGVYSPPRNVVYGFGLYSGTFTFNELNQVSQVCSSVNGGPMRWSYGYQAISNGEGSETVPTMSTISVPSPTGTGQSTASIQYWNLPASNGFYPGMVTSTIDANGNTRYYNVVGANQTQVLVEDTQPEVVYQYNVTFNADMSELTRSDGAGRTLYTLLYNGPDPKLPSVMFDGNGNEWQYTWDGYGNLTQMITPRGVTHKVTFTSYPNAPMGAATQVQETSTQAGSRPPTTITYDPNGDEVTSITPPAPQGTQTSVSPIIQYSYDGLGNISQVIIPGDPSFATATEPGGTTNFAYAPSGGASTEVNEPTQVTNANGASTNMTYFHGQLSSFTDAGYPGNTSGNETDLYVNAALQTTEIQYPATGQTGSGRAYLMYNYQYPGGPLASIVKYDEQGNAAATVTFTYGPEGELLSRSGNTRPVSFTYDGIYRLKTLTYTQGPGASFTTAYSYLPAGELSKIVYPDGDSVQFPTYDPVGDPTERIDGNGAITYYDYYDSENLLTDIVYPTAYSSYDVTLQYDGWGRLQQVKDASGTRVYARDNRDDVTQVTATTTAGTQDLYYGYNPSGSREYMEVNGGVFWYYYQPDGRYTSFYDPYDTKSTAGYGWNLNANGWPAIIDLQSQNSPGGQAHTKYQYYGDGELKELTNFAANGQQLSDFLLAHDALGNVSQMVATYAAPNSAYSGTINYVYDTPADGYPNGTGGQLMGETSTRSGTVPAWTYAYDGAGNPQTFRSRYGITYNGDNQNTAISYDNNGDPTYYGYGTTTFDLEGGLLSYDSSSMLNQSDGLRSHLFGPDGSVTYWYYDGSDPVYEANGSNAMQAENVFFANGLMARRTSASAITYYQFDPFGNPVERLDSTGSTVLSAAAFDDYGKAYITGTVSPWDPYSQFGAQAGYYADAYTGLELAGSRYYDISTGRWLSRDPAGYAGGINEYEYAGNNPLGNVDPSGLFSVEIDSPGGTPLLAFDNQDVGDGLQTGLAATGSAFSFGLWNGGQWRCHLGYAGAHSVANIGANAASIAATAGLGEAFAAARAARALQAAGEIGEGAGEAAEAGEDSVSLFHGSTNNYSDIMANGLDTERAGATYTSTSREAAADAINPARRVDPIRDPGIIESRVPRASFNEMLQSGDIGVRPYRGFYPYLLNTSEFFLKTPAAKALFNGGIVR